MNGPNMLFDYRLMVAAAANAFSASSVVRTGIISNKLS